MKALKRKIRRFLKFGRVFFSIRSKILVLALTISFFSSFFISGFYYFNIRRSAIDESIKNLAQDSHIMQPQFNSVFEDLRSNVLVLSKLPPIQGIIRSTYNGGIDPEDGSSLEQWRQRLETIFASVISTRPYYTQIRYIGLADHGQELVRVNYNGKNIEIVKGERLQQKEEEPYFKQALNLPPGKVYFSTVSIKREYGKMVEPFLPVIRTIVPVYDDSGKMFGLLIINAAYEKLLEKVIKNLSFDEDLFIVDDAGDYLLYQKESGHYGFVFGENLPGDLYNKIFVALFQEGINNKTTTYEIEGKEYIAHFHTFYFDAYDISRFLAYGLIKEKSAILLDTYKVRNQSVLLAFGLILLSMIFAYIMAKWLIKPLNQMIASVRAYEGRVSDVSFPTGRFDEIGELARAFNTLTRRLERARDSEVEALARLQSIIDNTADGLVTINEQGIIEYYSRACEEIFGYAADEVLGVEISVILQEGSNSKLQKMLRKASKQEGQIGTRRELEGKHKNGGIIPIDLALGVVHIHGEKFYSSIIRDITKRKKAEQEIIRSNEELEQFAYVASHDLQEPLRTVSNFSSLLQEEYEDKVDEQAQQYLRFISEGSERMQNLIADLLIYSRVGSEKTGDRTFNSEDCVKDCIKSLADTIEQTQAKVIIGNLPELYLNPVRFTRLIQNLVANSIKYRADGRKPKIEISAKKQGSNWLFCVKDNGIGIKEEYLHHVFVIFRRLHQYKDHGGTGIGLAICKKIVESFGGKIWAESEIGKGTSFFFTIPVSTEKKKRENPQ